MDKTNSNKKSLFPELSIQQFNAIGFLLTGMTDKAVAEKIGVRRETITRWRLKNFLFKAALNKRRLELWEACSDQMRNLLPIRDDRIGRDGSYVKKPALTQGLTIQPQVIQDLECKSSFIGEGFLGRFLYVYPDSMVGRRKTGHDVPHLDADAENTYHEIMGVLLSTEPLNISNGVYDPHSIAMPPEALEVKNAFESEVELMLAEGGELSYIQDWGGKLVGNCIRIAGFLHLADQLENPNITPGELWHEPISKSAMERAVSLGYALIPHAKKFYKLLDYDPMTSLCQYIMGRILSTQNPGSISKRELWRLTDQKAGINTVSDLDKPLLRLEYHNIIRITKDTSTGGRPSTLIEVNPKYLSSISSKNSTIQPKASVGAFDPIVPAFRVEEKNNVTQGGDNLEKLFPKEDWDFLET